jgi:hypothetical protein
LRHQKFKATPNQWLAYQITAFELLKLKGDTEQVIFLLLFVILERSIGQKAIQATNQNRLLPVLLSAYKILPE